MAKWIFTRANGPWSYPTLGFTATLNDVIEADNAPDAWWEETDSGATVTIPVEIDSDFVETPGDSVLAYDQERNEYGPKTLDELMAGGGIPLSTSAVNTAITSGLSPAAAQAIADTDQLRGTSAAIAAADPTALSAASVAAGPVPMLYGAPVTITETAGTATTIAGSTAIPRTDAAFRYEGLNAGDTGSHYYFLALTGSGTASNPWRVSFDFNGAEFEVRAFRASSNFGGFRAWIDGQPTSPEMRGLANSSNSMVKFTLPDARPRRITLEFDRGFNFSSIYIPSGTAITATTSPNPKRLAVIGDSFVWGAGIAASAQNALGFPQSLGRALGWPQVANLGVGGSGYTVAGSGGGKYADAARMTALTTFAPDYVLVTGTQNDKNAAAGLINSEADALFAAIASALPAAQIVATSVLFPAEPTVARGGFDKARRAEMDAEISLAASDADIPFIDASTWFNGTGRLGETEGDGNADLFRSALDWNHPSAAGHDYIARRTAPEFRRAVGIA